MPMSYVDGRLARNQKILHGGIISLIQGGLAQALADGFAVTVHEKAVPAEHSGSEESTPDTVRGQRDG
jgi:protein TonB